MSSADNMLFDLLAQMDVPILVARDGWFRFSNDAAVKRLPADPTGRPVTELFPLADAGKLCGAVSGAVCAATVTLRDGWQLFTLSREALDDDEQALLAFLGEQLRAPLSSLRIAMDAVLPRIEELDAQGLDEQFASVCKPYFQIARLARRVDAIAALRGGAPVSEPRVLDLVALLRDLVQTVSTLTKERGIALRFETQLPEAEASVDPTQVEDALLQLLDNSLFHCAPGNTIRLSLTQRDRIYIVSVEDDGPGISEEVLSTIFDLRLRKKSLSDPNRGLGLGLPYARQLIRQNGGAMVLESRPGRGTAVRFSLPARKKPLRLEDRQAAYNSDKPRYNLGPVRDLYPVLTELSNILAADCYTVKYLD